MEKLNELRKKINRADEKLIKCLVERLLISQKIGQEKRRLKNDVIDKVREKELKLFHQSLAIKYGLSLKFVKNLFKLILNESKRLQR